MLISKIFQLQNENAKWENVILCSKIVFFIREINVAYNKDFKFPFIECWIEKWNILFLWVFSVA